MKEALPKDKEAKIAKDARETVQECVSDFISFVTAEAREKCAADKRRTINGNDLIYAMKQLGFDRYLQNLELYYSKYQEAHHLYNSSILAANQVENKTKADEQPNDVDKAREAILKSQSLTKTKIKNIK